MHKKKVIVLAALVAAVAAGTSALAAPPPTAVEKPAAPPVVLACPPYVLPPASTFQTDWAIDHPQGWLDRASIENALLYCDYGIDRAKPADRPAFRLHRPLPQNMNCAVDASNTSITCTPRTRILTK